MKWFSSNWLPTRKQRSLSRQAGKVAPRVRLSVEALEGRLVPATTGLQSTIQTSAAEQYLVELINDARAAPLATVAR